VGPCTYRIYHSYLGTQKNKKNNQNPTKTFKAHRGVGGGLVAGF
jgi:hypothetical protein